MPILGILSHMIVNLGTKNRVKTTIFVSKYFINLLIIQNPLDVKNRNFDTAWVLMKVLCVPSLGASGHVTAILEAENRKKWTNLNRHISVITNIDEKRFVV